MLIFENINLAIRGLLVSKMRSLLTMLGIIIGIGSVIGIMTVGNSMTASVTSSMQSMGANNITVSLTQKSSSDITQGSNTKIFKPNSYKDEDLITEHMISEYKTMYADDIYALGLSESLGEYDISPSIGNNTSSSSSYDEAPISLMGANNDYQKVKNIEIINGRFIDSKDNERTVAVVSDVVANALFPDEDPIGKSFTLTYNKKIYTFYIIGVYQYESNGMPTTSKDDLATTTMYCPLDTAKNISNSANGYSSFTVVANSSTDTSTFMTETENLFSSFYIRNDSYTVTTSSMESMLESMTSMLSTISLAISIIAGISLVVGGIGVMNIMLVSITERTKEIGTRKALGATNNSIRAQFIIEAIIICLIGGIIGILAGLLLGSFGAKMLGYEASPSISVILGAVGFSMVIGVFFGYYPANKAAKLDPVEALRYE